MPKFRQPDCLLIRVGELALKSPSVQRRMFGILLSNMRFGLTSKKVKFRFEVLLNRAFVWTKELKKAARILQKIFGITSISPAWVCRSSLNEIRLLAVDIAENILRLGPEKSFAIRPRRTGRHPFTTRAIAEEAGAAVKRITGAKVNLTKPDAEILIECRSRRTYIFIEKMPAVGGLPLGSAGRVLAIINNLQAAVAAWLVMHRGCELIIMANRRSVQLARKLRKWHIGRSSQVHISRDFSEFRKLAEQKRALAVIVGERIKKQLLTAMQRSGLLILRPLVGWEKAKIAELAEKVY